MVRRAFRPLERKRSQDATPTTTDDRETEMLSSALLLRNRTINISQATIGNMFHNFFEGTMRYNVLLFGVVLFTISGIAFANDGGKGNEDQRRSVIGKFDNNASYPRPFPLGPTDNPNPNPAVKNTVAPTVSTGYYIVDGNDNADPVWKTYPFLFPVNEIDLNYQPTTWRSIVSGPHQFPDNYWIGHPEGRPYFQNPATKTSQLPYGTDSTDNAFAGPIPIGFPFYFNGVRYDSFYVSTNGIIALSNRRYFYDENGQRVEREIAPGVFSYYDPEREDTRAPQGSSGATDPTPDDYGYRCIALGKTPGTGPISESSANAQDGIRNGNNRWSGNDGINSIANFTNNPPLILPCWGNLQLSVYNPQGNYVDDYGKVYYKRSISGDRLIIWYHNLTPRGTWNFFRGGSLQGTFTYNADIRPGDRNFISASVAVVLNRSDSSIHIVFTNLQGVAFDAFNRPYTARDMFRNNTTMAVRGQARHNTYNSLDGSSSPITTRYLQYTVYYTQTATGFNPKVYVSGTGLEDNSTPAVGVVVQFKQWKNTVRAVTTEYRVKPRDPNQPADYTVVVPSQNVNNFELLAGDERLGGIQPIAIFQNLSNDIQGPRGVNYQPQNIKFSVRFRIVNDATGRVVYNRLVRINSFFSDNSNWTVGGYRLGTIQSAGANQPPVFTPTSPAPSLNGVPPYAYVQVQFPPFEPNEFIDDQIGRFTAYVIAVPIDSNGLGYKDMWPFDDTVKFRLFVMRRLAQLNEDVREYHVVGGNAIPSVLKFVNIGGEVVDGNESTNNPPPPRGEFAAANNQFFRLNTPVIRLDRIIDGVEPSPPGGDELRTFPIDLRDRKGAVLSFAFHRAVKQDDYPRGWADSRMLGPEPRVAYFDQGPTGGIVAPGNTADDFQDVLRVEFARPSRDQINNIVVSQVPGAPPFEWNWHPRCCNQSAITDNPAWSVWGGGGYRRGFHPVDKDTPLTRAQGIVVDPYDDGKDFEWRKVYIPIPDTFINAPNEGAKNFRFRFRVMARPHTWLGGPDDDEDPFFIKNIRILFPTEVTDLEVVSVLATWPYRVTPASQAQRIPIRVKISNNTGLAGQAFPVRVMIADPNEAENPNLDQRYVYDRTVVIPFISGNQDREMTMPAWNARTSARSTDDRYIIAATVKYPGGDLEPRNDSTYSTFRMQFGSAFSYHDQNAQNDVPNFLLPPLFGKGLNLLGFQSAAYTVATAFGADGGNGSGQIAMKFELTTQDTVFGYQAWFGSLNSNTDNIRFAIYQDQGGVPAGNPIQASVLRTYRGMDVSGDVKYNEYTTYVLPQPLVLPPGTYWASVAQLSSVGFELGATSQRMGIQLGNYNAAPVPGANNYNLLIDKSFRIKTRTGALINDNKFVFENSVGSGQWAQFVPTIGNVAYNHLTFSGQIGNGFSFTRGSWLPMIRPFIGNRTYGPRKYVRITPVEITLFEGAKRPAAVDLWWETSSETDNHGFFVERRTLGAEEWMELGFVPTQASNGTSSKPLSYSFTDRSVSGGKIYEYRLRQVSRDGSVGYSGTLRFDFTDQGDIVLEQNAPNPFSSSTMIAYTVPVNTLVELEVVDVLGNVVKTLVHGEVQSGYKSVRWDGTDNLGKPVSNGTYICRLKAGDRIEVMRMSLVR